MNQLTSTGPAQIHRHKNPKILSVYGGAHVTGERKGNAERATGPVGIGVNACRSTMPVDDLADDAQANAIARRRPKGVEHLEYLFGLVGLDPGAIIAHGKDAEAVLGLAADLDATGGLVMMLDAV